MEKCAVRRVRIAIDEGTTAQAQPHTAGRSVLIATGDSDFREAADRVLTREGYCVLTAAHSGHAVLACVANTRIDIVVTDLASEEMSGPELADTLRRYHPGLRALFVTDAAAEAGAGAADDARINADAAAAVPGAAPARFGIILRPLTRESLLAGLDALCEDATSTPAS
jgi:CheY-like chemotaxis protein